MSDDAFPLQALWMSDPSVGEEELMSAVNHVIERDRAARVRERRIRGGGVVALTLLVPTLVWSAAFGVTPLVRGAYALMAVGCAAIIAAELVYLEWTRQALPGAVDARSQLQKTAFMLARQIRLIKMAPLWSAPVFIGVALIAVWLYRERTHAGAFALCAVAVTAWIATALGASAMSAKLNDRRLQFERVLSQLQYTESHST